jgi:Ni,Fe-hydrogenase III small subunit/ferredoxin-like protein FixX
MITDVVFRSLKSHSQLVPVEQLLTGCDGSRMPEVVVERLTPQIAAAVAEVCPTRAISADSSAKGDGALKLDYGKCIGCGRCIDLGQGAIVSAERFSRCGVSRENLVATWPIGSAAGEAQPITPDLARNQVYAMLGRALNVRQLDPGSCNGCEMEISALTNPYYDLERFGIHFVASPKHADMLLVTGPITRNMALAARKTYEAVPAPKLVVAVGACGCSGGIFTGSQEPNPEIAGPVDALLPVDGYIPGCPPTPAMLVSGILKVLRRSLS